MLYQITANYLQIISSNHKERKLQKTRVLDMHCFCSTIKPISTISQLLGIFPISLNHLGSPSLSEKTTVSPSCQLQSKFYSCPSILNMIFTLNFFYLLYWIQFNMLEVLSALFKGTDLYALNIEATAKYFQVVILLMFSRLKKSAFCAAWSTLLNVSNNLEPHSRCPNNPSKSSLWKLKLYAYGILIGIGIFSLSYIVFFSIVVVHPCVTGGSRIQKCEIFSTAFLQKLAHTFIILYSQLFSALFLILSLILRALHVEICKKLKSTLNDIEIKSTNLQHRYIEKLRILHENLCVAADNMSKYFGFPSLVVCCCAVFSITTGIYSTILSQLTKRNGISYIYYFIWCFHMFFGVFSLIHILIAGQIVKNAGSSARRVLHGATYSRLSADTKIEVSIFLDKLNHTVCIDAFGIMEISSGFLATASANIVTYLLVLLQFRLSVDEKFN